MRSKWQEQLSQWEIDVPTVLSTLSEIQRWNQQMKNKTNSLKSGAQIIFPFVKLIFSDLLTAMETQIQTYPPPPP